MKCLIISQRNNYCNFNANTFDEMAHTGDHSIFKCFEVFAVISNQQLDHLFGIHSHQCKHLFFDRT